MEMLDLIWSLSDEAGDDCGAAFDAAVPGLGLSPLPAGPFEQQPEWAERARATLLAGAPPEWPSRPFPEIVEMTQYLVVDTLLALGGPGDRLYALEFQGAARQYVMFGHTTNLKLRLAEHVRAATPHGWALLNGWVSPPLEPDAKPAERAVLMAGGLVHDHLHYRERFFDLPWARGRDLARCIAHDYTRPEMVDKLRQAARLDRRALRGRIVKRAPVAPA